MVNTEVLVNWYLYLTLYRASLGQRFKWGRTDKRHNTFYIRDTNKENNSGRIHHS